MERSQDQSNSRESALIKILILGDQTVGKTSLLHRYTKSVYAENMTSTLGVDFKQKEVSRCGNTHFVQIWDSAGQERFRTVTRTYYRMASGILIAFDGTNIKSFLNVRQWIKSIKDEIESTVPLILVNTKCDLPEAVSQVQVKDFAKSFDLVYFRTSSKTGEGVNELFDYIIDEILRRNESKRPALRLSSSLSKKKKTCC